MTSTADQLRDTATALCQGVDQPEPGARRCAAPSRSGVRRPTRQLPRDLLVSLAGAGLVSGLYLVLAGGTATAWAISPLLASSLFLLVRHGYFTIVAPRELRTRREAATDLSRYGASRVVVVWPTRNEPREVLEHVTLRSLLGLRWPGELWILVADNSDPTHPGLQAWRRHLEQVDRTGPPHVHVRFLHRPDPDADTPAHREERLCGYKGGNLDMAIDYAKREIDADYYLLVDTDSTFPADALVRAIPELDRDPEIGFVQLSTLPTNGTCNPLTRAAAGLLAVQRLSLGSRGREGFLCFYGHNAVFTKSAIAKAGSWVGWMSTSYPPRFLHSLLPREPQAVLTEDLDASVKLYGQGLRGVPSACTAGEWAPFSLSEWRTMWLRWAYATIQVVVGSGRGATLPWRVRYGLWCHYAQYAVEAARPLCALVGACVATPGVLLALNVILAFSFANDCMTTISACRLSAPARTAARWRSVPGLFVLIASLGALTCWVQAQAFLYFARLRNQGWSSPTAKGVDGAALAWHRGVADFRSLIVYLLLLVVLLIVNTEPTVSGALNRALPALFGVMLATGLLVFGRCQRRGRAGSCGACDLGEHCPGVRAAARAREGVSARTCKAGGGAFPGFGQPAPGDL